jgi:hypothetical protein
MAKGKALFFFVEKGKLLLESTAVYIFHHFVAPICSLMYDQLEV